MTKASDGKPAITPDEEAAGFVVRNASDQRTLDDHARLEAWLQTPNNAERFAEHDALWAAIGGLADDEEARALLAAPDPASRRSFWSRRRILAAGGVGAVAASSIGFLVAPRMEGQTLETAPGEQRRLALSDGSSIMLNTATRLRVRFDAHERHILLDQGQAFFQVAKDPARPFRVFAGETEVRALGTAFDVNRVGDGAHVVLEEGVVALYRGTRGRRIAASAPGSDAPAGEAPLALLKPGEEASVQPDAPVDVVAADLGHAQAWRYGRFILDAAPLGDTVADINRYGGKQIRLASPELATLRVSGVFHVGQPDRFVEGVTAALPLRVASDDGTTIVLDHK